MQVKVDFKPEQILEIIMQLGMEDKLEILKKLEADTFEYRLSQARSNPGLKMKNTDVVKEVKKHRKNI